MSAIILSIIISKLMKNKNTNYSIRIPKLLYQYHLFWLNNYIM